VVVPVPAIFHAALLAKQRKLFPRNQVRLPRRNNQIAAGAAIFLLRVFFANRLHHIAGTPFRLDPAHTRADSVKIKLVGLLVAIAMALPRH